MASKKKNKAVSHQVDGYARMWPREIFDCPVSDGRNYALAGSLEFLENPGVYILYREDVPYYIGKTNRKLRYRIQDHATQVGGRYYNHWNFFSAFVIKNAKNRNEIEGILIAAMPTANSANPKLQREKFPNSVKDMVRRIRRTHADPLTEDKISRLIEDATLNDV